MSTNIPTDLQTPDMEDSYRSTGHPYWTSDIYIYIYMYMYVCMYVYIYIYICKDTPKELKKYGELHACELLLYPYL